MKTAIIFESTVEATCPQVEIDELRENTEEIGAALKANGFQVHIIPFSLDLVSIRNQIDHIKPDVVFNLVDSIEGKGNIIAMAPMLCEHMGIPFTGAGSMATTLSCDKLITKSIVNAAKLPTVYFETEDAICKNPKELDASFILKSVSEHASFGMFADSVVSTRTELRTRLMEKKAKYGGDWFAEVLLEGREFNISILATPQGPRVLPHAEILFTNDFPEDKPKIVDYTAKWHYDSPECIGTIRHFEFKPQDAPLLEELTTLTKACWSAFGLSGYARVDFRTDANGVPFILEVNCNPFLTAQEGMGAAAARGGISFDTLIGSIVEDALSRHHMQTRIAA
jgi:D-alanine-D-alanine ligase